MVRVSVKNFGPIAEGSVDLKPLTIFIGPSNTGKSFMAGAIYAVARAFSQFAGNNPPSHFPRDVGFPFMPSFAPRPEVVHALNEWIRQVQLDGQESIDVHLPGLSETVVQAVERYLYFHVQRTCRSFVDELQRIYGRTTDIKRRDTDEGTLGLIQPPLALSFGIDDSGVEAATDNGISPELITTMPLTTIPASLIEQARTALDHGDDMLIQHFHSNIFRLFGRRALLDLDMSLLNTNAYYLPAARSGIAQGHKVLAAALVRQSSWIGMESFNIPTLPGIATEFLGNILTLDRHTANLSRHDEFAKAVGFIEHEVLHGSIDLDESGGLPFPDIAYEQDGAGKFTLDHTSSMVSELAPLVLFLKYLVRPGDLLILEEPESHLHPAAQRQMARGIVRLVNAGVKVLITTHSDLFLAQVNNLMRINHASRRWLREKGFAPEECIDREKVGAYLFRWNEEQGGNVVEELEIRADVGIDDAMFGEVVNEIYEETLLVERIRIP